VVLVVVVAAPRKSALDVCGIGYNSIFFVISKHP
jgi:hypothetical protein